MAVLSLPILRMTCPVCASPSLHTDEVVDRERWLLGECPRCEHRFTRRLGPAPAMQRARPRAEEAHAAA